MAILGPDLYKEFFDWVVKKKLRQVDIPDFVKWAVKHPQHGAAMRAMEREGWFDVEWELDMCDVFGACDRLEFDDDLELWKVTLG